MTDKARAELLEVEAISRQRVQKSAAVASDTAASRMVRIGDVCRAVNGRAFKPSEWTDKGIPIIRIQNLNNREAPFNYFAGTLADKFKVKPGDLLFAWSGTPGTSFGAHIWRGPDAALNQHIFNLHYDPALVDSRYFCYAINRNITDYVTKAQGGVGLAHITKDTFENSVILLPPINQQKQIVAEIEKQSSRLDDAVANLKRVKADIKRYKAAVLNAAVEGRLVEPEARIAQREGRSYESGQQLIQRLLGSRRNRWRGKNKYKEPAGPEVSSLVGLPAGWAYATAEQLTEGHKPITYGVIKLGPPVGGGVPVLRSSDVRYLRVDLDSVKSISPEIAANYQRTCLVGGEVLVTVRGTLGGVAVAPLQCKGFNISREVARLVPLDPEMARLVVLFVASKQGDAWLRHHRKGVAYTGVNIEALKKLPIPVPPTAEQGRIVAEVDRRLSLLQKAETQVDAAYRRALRLRRAVLVRLFPSSQERSAR